MLAGVVKMAVLTRKGPPEPIHKATKTKQQPPRQKKPLRTVKDSRPQSHLLGRYDAGLPEHSYLPTAFQGPDPTRQSHTSIGLYPVSVQLCGHRFELFSKNHRIPLREKRPTHSN